MKALLTCIAHVETCLIKYFERCYILIDGNPNDDIRMDDLDWSCAERLSCRQWEALESRESSFDSCEIDITYILVGGQNENRKSGVR